MYDHTNLYLLNGEKSPLNQTQPKNLQFLNQNYIWFWMIETN